MSTWINSLNHCNKFANRTNIAPLSNSLDFFFQSLSPMFTFQSKRSCWLGWLPAKQLNVDLESQWTRNKDLKYQSIGKALLKVYFRHLTKKISIFLLVNIPVHFHLASIPSVAPPVPFHRNKQKVWAGVNRKIGTGYWWNNRTRWG